MRLLYILIHSYYPYTLCLFWQVVFCYSFFALASKPFLRTTGYHLGTKRGGVQDDAKRSSAVQEGETGGSAALNLKKQNRRATKDSVDCILSTEHKNVVFQKCPICIALSASGLSYRADHSTEEKHFFLSWKQVQKQQATPQSYQSIAQGCPLHW